MRRSVIIAGDGGFKTEEIYARPVSCICHFLSVDHKYTTGLDGNTAQTGIDRILHCRQANGREIHSALL